MELNQHIAGCILGTAVGDSIGLPREGMSRRRALRVFGDGPLHHALLGSRGMCSDDTEHTTMVAQAVISTGGDPASFARNLAGRLRWWLARLPAGVGFGTLRACSKLWLGFGSSKSGVPSAGNGPAMRSALLGIVAEDREHMVLLVRESTRLTHTDPRAEQGATIVAMASYVITHEPQLATEAYTLVEMLAGCSSDSELRSAMKSIEGALEKNLTAEAFANRLGLTNGVSGFVNHTVPVAIYCWLRHRDSFRNAVEAAVRLGGDTDTVGAIVGAIMGTEVGPDALPEEWVDGLAEWPASVPWMRNLAEELKECVQNGEPSIPTSCSSVFLLLRNVFFMVVVMAHGIRRLLPPY
ncbi:MAG: ADP-ribosylglycohydrolase family protein [Planctomycetes bacterium]|nr:ADP-ribosylglycohydrolase family protein [Planctomycetota bacterium]